MPGKELEKVPRCKVCALDDDTRAGVEMLAMISCATWNIARTRVNNTFGLSLTSECLRKHMTEHPLHKTALEQGIILDAIKGQNGTSGIISVESMLQTLLVQGMMDLAKGKIRCKTPSELIAVINTMQNFQTRKNTQEALQSGDVSSFYAVMAAYGEAIKDTVSVSQLHDIVAKANALGANFNIGNTQLEPVIEVEPEDYMRQCVDDYRTLGRSRTRDELLEAGVISEIEEELELPS